MAVVGIGQIIQSLTAKFDHFVLAIEGESIEDCQVQTSLATSLVPLLNPFNS